MIQIKIKRDSNCQIVSQRPANSSLNYTNKIRLKLEIHKLSFYFFALCRRAAATYD